MILHWKVLALAPPARIKFTRNVWVELNFFQVIILFCPDPNFWDRKNKKWEIEKRKEREESNFTATALQAEHLSSTEKTTEKMERTRRSLRSIDEEVIVIIFFSCVFVSNRTLLHKWNAFPRFFLDCYVSPFIQNDLKFFKK